ncbi:MAG: DUF411 domain-containing protein [Blastomonas fulva]|uniref:DUF411 domain-containing protein n=1 Tax=Blastomonas fulva TaxID=1550728 RepID=UPI0040347091
MKTDIVKSVSNRTWTLMALALLAACSNAAQAATYTMFRDPNCGCCMSWAGHVERNLNTTVTTIDSVDMAKVKAQHGVPPELQACHTMIVDGYVIEGHVPSDAIARLLRDKPKGVTGLAVAGMPMGSPGMEAGGRVQPYSVVAFGPAGQQVFAHYP